MDKTLRGCHIDSKREEKKYSYGALISPTQNINIFSKKKIFCMACDSKTLGQDAIQAGAKVFIGFNEVPFFLTDKFKEVRVSEKTKSIIRKILFSSITYAIDNNLTFNDFSLLLKFEINVARNNLLLNKAVGYKLNIEIANTLGRIKNGITLFGDGNLKLME